MATGNIFACSATVEFTHLNDLRVEFIWTVDEQTQAVVDLRIVG